MTRSRWITLFAFIGAVLLAGYIWADVVSRSDDRPRTANEQGPQTPTVINAPVSRGPQKDATCRTTPGEGQPAMSHEDCAFIASQIAVLASETSPQIHSDRKAPAAKPKPGSDISPDVRELKPLPEAIVDKLPALRGYQYYLSGQDIVVVGNGAKIAFVVDVRIRP